MILDNVDRHITGNWSDGLDVTCYACGWKGHEDDCKQVPVEDEWGSVIGYTLLCPDPDCGMEL